MLVFNLCAYFLVARRMTYPTLNVHMVRATTCALDDPEFIPDRESARNAVLYASQSVVGISSSIGNIRDTFPLYVQA
jgi:hypothetical protein